MALAASIVMLVAIVVFLGLFAIEQYRQKKHAR